MSSNNQYSKINKWIEMLQRTDLESPQGIQLSMLISDRIAWAIDAPQSFSYGDSSC